MHLLRKLRRRRLRVVDLRANAISHQRLTTQRPSTVFLDLKKCRLAALPFNCHICAHTPTLLKRNRYRAYKLQMELQSTLVHEALAAVVALDRRIKLRADVLERAVARPRLPLVSLQTDGSVPAPEPRVHCMKTNRVLHRQEYWNAAWTQALTVQ